MAFLFDVVSVRDFKDERGGLPVPNQSCLSTMDPWNPGEDLGSDSRSDVVS